MLKTYNDMLKFTSFEDRFKYLRLNGQVGSDTFGYDRYLNQAFYHSPKWRSVRNKVIIRDCGCDLACEGYEIFDRIYIHHINPISLDDMRIDSSVMYDLNNLVCVSFDTHQAIHYSDITLLPEQYVPRFKNDTIPWR